MNMFTLDQKSVIRAVIEIARPGLLTWDTNIYPAGDLNADYEVNILDVIVMVNYILDTDTNNLELADLNDDMMLDILDIILLINIILGQ